MRQFLTYSFIVSASVIGFFKWKDSITWAPNVGTPMTATAPLTSTPKTSKVLARKDKKHESKRHLSNPNAQRPRLGEDEGSSISADEIESLTSIYQDQEGQLDAQSGSTVETKNIELPKSRRTSPIPGVNVAAWVRSNQNHINTEVPDPRIGSGMRVFLNCVELKKKGASPLEQRECEKVLAKKDSVQKASLHFN